MVFTPWWSYQSQLTSLYSSWAKDRQDLLLKVKGTFSEAWVEYENEQVCSLQLQEYIQIMCMDKT